MILKLFISALLLFTFIQCDQKKQDTPKAKEINIEKEMGTGLLSLTLNKPIKFYKNPKDSSAFDQLNFSIDSLPQTKGKLLFSSTSKLNPYRMLSGDSDKEGQEHINRGLIRFQPELIFRVLEKTKDFFKIIVNEDTFETAYMKINAQHAIYTKLSQVFDNNCSNCTGSSYNTDYYLYETWENYFKRLEYITVDDLKIYDNPNGKLIFEQKNNDFLPFLISQVKGDWIQLKKHRLYKSKYDKSMQYEGWVRWKSDMDILVNIVEQTYE